MKKNRLKRILASAMALTMLVAVFASCNGGEKGSSSNQKVLKIEFFKGGIGEEWLKSIAEAFEKEHEGVKVEIKGDPGLTEKMAPKLESGSNLPDLAFVLQTNWQGWAVKGYLEDLSDIYGDIVEDDLTLYDKILDGDKEYGKINGKYWIVPWTDGVTGFIYNSKMFEENGWKVPETVAELEALLPKIKEKGISPFAWGGKVAAYWSFPVNGWWAQYEGYEGIEEYKAMESPEVYSQEGRLKALEVFQRLVTDESNSVDGAAGMDHIQSQMAFVQGKAAMIPNGAWLETEMLSSTPDGFEMKMMKLPAIDGAKDSNTNYGAAGDFIVVPSGAKNKDLAKEFLKFMARDDMLKLFTQKCGTPRPFKYETSNIEGLTTFTKSVLGIWENSKNIYLFSDNPIYYSNFYDWPLSGAPYMAIFVGDETAQSVYQSNAKHAKDEWESVKKKVGLS